MGDILAKADKMTMAHSLELRVPFLDIEISKIAATFSPDMKWKNGETKSLLREAVKDIVPENIRTRKKLGFPTPIYHMIKKNHLEIKEQIMENSYIKIHFNLDIIENLFFEQVQHKKDNSSRIFALLMLAVWHERYFN